MKLRMSLNCNSSMRKLPTMNLFRNEEFFDITSMGIERSQKWNDNCPNYALLSS
jgi:hypothetical protein